MIKVVFAAILLSSLVSANAQNSESDSSACSQSETYIGGGPRIYPGKYSVTVEQFGEAGKSKKIRGSLTIVCDWNHWSDTKTYGFMEIAFHTLDAPVVSDLSGPHPASQNPNAPGVLIRADKDSTILQIGSHLNELSLNGRDNVVRYKGPGLAVKISKASRERFDGEWEHDGPYSSGRGWFYAVRVSK